MDDLKSSPSLERNYKELVYLLPFHYAGVIGSAKSSPFLPGKSALFVIDLKGLGNTTPEVMLEGICELFKQSRTAVVIGNNV